MIVCEHQNVSSVLDEQSGFFVFCYKPKDKHTDITSNVKLRTILSPSESVILI